MTDEKQPIDWEAIERDYRTGTMAIREMARWFSISEGAIRKRAKAGGWRREEIEAREERAQRAPAHPVPTITITPTVLTPEAADPKAIVDRGRNLVLRLLDELNATTCQQGELEYLIEQATASDEDDRRREALMKAVSLPIRANTLKALATAAKTLAETTAPDGKKARAQENAKTAGAGSGWGEDLHMPAVRAN